MADQNKNRGNQSDQGQTDWKKSGQSEGGHETRKSDQGTSSQRPMGQPREDHQRRGSHDR
jgi:hypothetical protein